jgi:predicted anti-sigma-YlaC factor YlaD
MDCRKFRTMVSRMLDGELAGAEGKSLLEEHLGSCEECRRFAEISSAGLAIHRSVGTADPPPSLLPSILAAVEVEPRRGWVRGWLRMAVPAFAAAAAVFGFWIGGLMHESFMPARTESQTDVLELSYLDAYPPGSMGAILMTATEGGGDEER